MVLDDVCGNMGTGGLSLFRGVVCLRSCSEGKGLFSGNITITITHGVNVKLVHLHLILHCSCFVYSSSAAPGRPTAAGAGEGCWALATRCSTRVAWAFLRVFLTKVAMTKLQRKSTSSRR